MNTSTTNTPFRHVPKALAVALSLAFAAPMAMHPAFAQDGAQAAPQPVPEENTHDRDYEYKEKAKRKSRGQMTMREKREARLRQLRESGDEGDDETSQEESSNRFPLATRENPDARPTRSGAKQLELVQEAYGNGDYAKAIASATAVAADADANAYDKSFAYLFAGNAASANGDDAAAADYFRKALDANGLDNNNHYTAMYNLAVVEYGLDQYQASLATLDRYLSETKKTDQVEAQNLRGALLVGMERYDDAAALYQEQLAANPDNKSLLLNAVSAYQQAGKDDQATALLADAMAKGQLTEPTSYRALYVSYINADRDADAAKIIEDGLAQGILQPSAQLARDYMVLGQKAYYNDDMPRAVELYKRAASMAEDGEAALNLAKIYIAIGKDAEAKAAAQQALDKGVKKPDEARELLGGA